MTVPVLPAPGRPRPSSAVRVHAAVALGVIAAFGSVGSVIAFFLVAFAGDGCGFADSPPICTSPLAAWTLMLEPALATGLALVAALVGVVVGGAGRAHLWPIAAWALWLLGGAAWLVVLAAVGLG
ncbi:hypothetical protein [Actinomycetospora sp. TBRC 11914]|uniref:hypothetical protein n=1 Tax=Actinomycetospora sp. TBRC 11914 TaxID=2729387 RepID=UPI00145E7D2C|nr:hypothetical protein [Actinomycetospora sp. TBRC 11914]NMO89745.1 hypothetical protein [Actinomycetospora sp. TBRC 11914]